MKKFFILGILLGMTACSSKSKTIDDGASETVAGSSETTVQKAKTESKSIKTTCTMNKEKRNIEVRATNSGGCEVYYTRGENEKSVASSGFGTKYCEEVSERIVGNLSKAGFNCQ